MRKLAVIVGTRPEAIKLAPVVQELARQPDMQPIVCNTGQHEQLCGQTLGYFGIEADAKLDVMRENQSLAALQGRLLAGLDAFLTRAEPDGVLVQGDTMSAFCGTLAAFYRRIPVFHVEAGLRSDDLAEPFPEEALRQMLARVASLHFAPTEAARTALLAEKIAADRIHVTGNTVIDALGSLTGAALDHARQQLEARVDLSKPLVLVTAHRRENHGLRLDRILDAVRALSNWYPACRFVVPVHPNPNVRAAVRTALRGRDNIVLTEPLSYPELVFVMRNAVLALSDSGGIQEEAPSFGLPVLVLRYETERREGLELGLAKLVGADTETIVAEARAVLDRPQRRQNAPVNPYGDGRASGRIVKNIREYVREKEMDRSFEVFLGRRLNAYSQEATRKRVNWLCEQAKGRVLDVGCSQGVVSWLLGHRGIQVTGLDLDEEAIAWARENLKNAAPEARGRIELICADFLEYNPDQCFGTILVGEYLEHLPDDVLDRHLAHMGRLLAPGGRVVVTVPLGLHPHPDHEQTFLPGNFAVKIGRHFSILHMDVEDAYLRCVCDLSEPKQTPDVSVLLELAEKGVIQIQQKANAGKSAANVAELQGNVRPEADVSPYLRQKRAALPDSPLVRALAAKGLEAPFLYDYSLFTTLNEIYRETPLVPQPRELSPQGLFTQADRRVDYLQKHFGILNGLHCLEIGCGRGETAVRLAERHGCRVTGVDAYSYPEWSERQSENVRLAEVDLTEHNPFAPASFDCIFSFAVLEHVQRPLAMLEVMFDLLKPGGFMYVTANLYRGPVASHCYREVFFPWPHLLFEDAVFMRFYRDLNARQNIATPAWVNRLTHLHYLEKVHELGFEVLKCTYSVKPFDEDFYQCFAEKLGKYPKGDLEKDFINLRLRKPEGHTSC